ncbi:hypothetical protein FA15DRAFT_703347 [Coprinopsis marcescibilis]|uniref:DUF6533 domain-containing protein n=1 Tax=Coprinopsis marcescibilis TaxID=230819 RepID=A0A5C3L1E4_COPMA|nr:hypothetical protein FA15DRAFT_703347 [Coprinopsis marcescibilis]
MSSYNAEQLIAMASATRVVYAGDLASLALWLADFLHTFPLEVELMWPAKFTLVNVFFFTLRYLPGLTIPLSIAFNASAYGSASYHTICMARTIVFAALSFLAVCFSQFLLSIRVYVLAERPRWLKFCFIGELIIAVGVALFITIKHGLGITIREPLHPAISCGQLSTEGWLVGILYVIILLTEVVMMIMSLIIGYRKYRRSRSRLVTILYRDGTVYFIAVAVSSATNIIISLAGHPQYILVILQTTLHAIFPTRMILHVREMAHQDHEWGTRTLNRVFGAKSTSTGERSGHTARTEQSIEFALSEHSQVA